MTLKTVSPLGFPVLVNAMEPPEASNKLLPDVTAVNDVALTSLPQVSRPSLTPQGPFVEVIVKLEVVPAKVIVARVWVDHVPSVNRPPISVLP